jgi:hypothetical protein
MKIRYFLAGIEKYKFHKILSKFHLQLIGDKTHFFFAPILPKIHIITPFLKIASFFHFSSITQIDPHSILALFSNISFLFSFTLFIFI